MPKHIGNPYDPAVRKTEHGAKLYGAWRRVREHQHCKEWDYFPAFYEWAMENGYTTGARLRMINTNGMHCPENSEWYIHKNNPDRIDTACAESWNKTVNRIRKYYGMPPVEVAD
jgi:hypothetical protein